MFTMMFVHICVHNFVPRFFYAYDILTGMPPTHFLPTEMSAHVYCPQHKIKKLFRMDSGPYLKFYTRQGTYKFLLSTYANAYK